MKMKESRNARPKLTAAVPISFEVPVAPAWYAGSRFSALTSFQRASRADC